MASVREMAGGDALAEAPPAAGGGAAAAADVGGAGGAVAPAPAVVGSAVLRGEVGIVLGARGAAGGAVDDEAVPVNPAIGAASSLQIFEAESKLRYAITAQLGRGANGVVYHATAILAGDLPAGAQLVVKVTNAAVNVDIMREVEALSKVSGAVVRRIESPSTRSLARLSFRSFRATRTLCACTITGWMPSAA
jgi:hypothetical protein